MRDDEYVTNHAAHTAASSDAVLDWLVTIPRFAPLPVLLGHLALDEAWLIGGAVRDFILGRCPEDVRDVDILYSGDLDRLARKLSGYYEIKHTAFGNPSVMLSRSLHVDIFPPATPWGSPLSVEKALTHCDASGNAVALHLSGSNVLDPTGGCDDLAASQTRLLPVGWLVDIDTKAALLTRVVNHATRLRLTIVGIDVADKSCLEVSEAPGFVTNLKARNAVHHYRMWRKKSE